MLSEHTSILIFPTTWKLRPRSPPPCGGAQLPGPCQPEPCAGPSPPRSLGPGCASLPQAWTEHGLRPAPSRGVGPGSARGTLSSPGACGRCVRQAGSRRPPGGRVCPSSHPGLRPWAGGRGRHWLSSCALPSQARLKFPIDYPYSPPAFRFLTKMWHPNIYEVSPPRALQPPCRGTRCAACRVVSGVGPDPSVLYPQTGDVCISILHPPVDDPQSGELPSERWNPTQNVR